MHAETVSEDLHAAVRVEAYLIGVRVDCCCLEGSTTGMAAGIAEMSAAVIGRAWVTSLIDKGRAN